MYNRLPKLRWNPSANFLAQEVHFVIGLSFVIASVAFHYPWWYGVVAIFIISLLKETVFDPIVEEAPFFWNGAEDFSFYLLGIAVATALVLLI
jgi:hypothetical protein